jgi:hypothetical protein
MNFQRLLRADVIAMVAAFALLFTMAVDWYTTTTGQEARRIESITHPQGAVGGDAQREIKADAARVAKGQERNAWQPFGLIDSVILVGLLATFVLAVAAGYLRAADKRFEPPLTPSSVAALTAGVTGLLVAYRAIQEPGFDSATLVESGVPLALVALGTIALAAGSAYRAEEEGRAVKALPEPEPEPEQRAAASS